MVMHYHSVVKRLFIALNKAKFTIFSIPQKGLADSVSFSLLDWILAIGTVHRFLFFYFKVNTLRVRGEHRRA